MSVVTKNSKRNESKRGKPNLTNNVPKLSPRSAQKHGGHQLQDVTEGVIDGKGQRIALDEPYEETEGKEGDQVPQSETRKESDQALLEGQRGTVIGQFFRPTRIFLFLLFFHGVVIVIIPGIALKGKSGLVQGTRSAVPYLFEEGRHCEFRFGILMSFV